MKRQILSIFIITFTFLSTINAQKSTYFPERNEQWKVKNPVEYQIDVKILDDAIEFARANEYSGSRDLRIAILKGFEREPYHAILGPTKKRG